MHALDGQYGGLHVVSSFLCIGSRRGWRRTSGADIAFHGFQNRAGSHVTSAWATSEQSVERVADARTTVELGEQVVLFLDRAGAKVGGIGAGDGWRPTKTGAHAERGR